MPTQLGTQIPTRASRDLTRPTPGPTLLPFPSIPLFTAFIREPRWHRTARAAFAVLFFLVWLEAVSCFVFFMILSKNGSPVPTPELSASVFNHGHVFYVAASHQHLYDLLLTTMKFAIPGTMLTGFLLPKRRRDLFTLSGAALAPTSRSFIP